MEMNGWRPTNVRKEFQTFICDSANVRRVTLDVYKGKHEMNAQHPWKTTVGFS